MKENILNAYRPPEHFKEVEKLPPVVEEVIDESTELWLIRIPANELGPADLLGKAVNLSLNSEGGIVGHFCNSKGDDFKILKHSKDETIQSYAINANGADPSIVRKISWQVGFRKSLTAKHSQEGNNGLRDVGVTEHEKRSRGLTSAKGALLDVEKPFKKKSRQSERA